MKDGDGWETPQIAYERRPEYTTPEKTKKAKKHKPKTEEQKRLAKLLSGQGAKEKFTRGETTFYLPPAALKVVNDNKQLRTLFDIRKVLFLSQTPDGKQEALLVEEIVRRFNKFGLPSYNRKTVKKLVDVMPAVFPAIRMHKEGERAYYYYAGLLHPWVAAALKIILEMRLPVRSATKMYIYDELCSKGVIKRVPYEGFDGHRFHDGLKMTGHCTYEPSHWESDMKRWLDREEEIVLVRAKRTGRKTTKPSDDTKRINWTGAKKPTKKEIDELVKKTKKEVKPTKRKTHGHKSP